MKKGLLLLFILSWALYAWGSGLLDVYKKGVIHLKPDPEFGKGTDWEELFFDYIKHMAVAPDGSLFITNSHQHNIFKFSPQGKLISKSGQMGQGPGDYFFPGDTSLLDDKYLVIGEDAEQRRISLSDLTGKVVNVLRTKYPPFSSIGLKNGKIAYMNVTFDARNKTKKTTVIIIDVLSRKEITVDSIETPYIYFMSKGITLVLGEFKGTVFLSKTKSGKPGCGSVQLPGNQSIFNGGALFVLLQAQHNPCTGNLRLYRKLPKNLY
jgi:hypothetical protein